MSVTSTGPLEIREDETDVLADGKRVGLTVREFEVFLTHTHFGIGHRFSPEPR